MALDLPLYLQGGSYSANAFRTLVDAAMKEGVVDPGDYKVTRRAVGANMSVDVAPGTVVLNADITAFQGKYMCRNTTTVNRAVTAAPSSGNSRIDIVVVQVRDAQLDGGLNNDQVINVIAGTPSSSPTIPATPVNATKLAQVLVTDTTTTIQNTAITDTRAGARVDTTTHAYGSMTDQNLPADSVYSDWGSPVTVLDPQRSVTVYALLTGQVASNTGGIAFANCRVGISVDGGATFSFTGAELGSTSNSNLDAQLFLSQHLVTARTTGDIVVKAHVKASSGGVAATASLGRLHVTVDPT